jgi:outer membrane lipoprotein carrier protein
MIPSAILALALAAAPAAASKSTVIAGLQAWLDGTTTLDARFRQSLVSSALGTTASESGRLYLERPGKIRWDYREPDPKIAILIGDRTTLYLPDDRQMTRGRLAPEQGLFPRLLAGRERVEELFDASLVATPDSGGKGAYVLRLVPKGSSQPVGVVTLTLRAKEYSIEAADLVDETGNRTTYAFSDVKRNRGVPVGIFAFEPPPGTELIDQP